MIPAALLPYKGIAKIIGYALLAALAAALLWWAVGQPRLDLAQEEKAHAALKATHTALLTKLEEAEAAVADRSKAERAAYDAGVKSAKDMRDKETTDAYNRGVDTGKRITAGTQRVRVEWRDRDCAATLEGASAGLGEGSSEVSGERAEAIGRLLADAGRDDATYAEAYRRLESAQKLLNACFEQPALISDER